MGARTRLRFSDCGIASKSLLPPVIAKQPQTGLCARKKKCAQLVKRAMVAFKCILGWLLFLLAPWPRHWSSFDSQANPSQASPALHLKAWGQTHQCLASDEKTLHTQLTACCFWSCKERGHSFSAWRRICPSSTDRLHPLTFHPPKNKQLQKESTTQ